MPIRVACASDREPIAALLSEIDNFNAEEVAVALELVDDSLLRPEAGYRTIVATDDEQLTGYLCFGPTPMTEAAVDLYWMAVDPKRQGQGVGRALVAAFEALVAGEGARVIRVETSSREGYGKTLAFYLRLDYLEAGRIPNFYTDGDDLFTLYKALNGAPDAR